MHQTLLHQYHLVLGARGALFDYCDTISNNDLLTPLPSFNNESIISLLTHVANCYVFWLGHYAMQEKRPFFKLNDQKDLASVKQGYEQVNLLLNEFLHKYGQALDVPVTLPPKKRDADLHSTTGFHPRNHT